MNRNTNPRAQNTSSGGNRNSSARQPPREDASPRDNKHLSEGHSSDEDQADKTLLDPEAELRRSMTTQQMQKLSSFGLLEAYEHVLRALCQAGLPEGNVYEFAAAKIAMFGKDFKDQKRRRELEKRFGKPKYDDDGTLI